MGGTVHFEQASEQAPTTITYKIQGNDPSAERGMHIHQFGDNTNGCTSAGPHCMFLSPPFFFLPLILPFLLIIYIIKARKEQTNSPRGKERKQKQRRKKKRKKVLTRRWGGGGVGANHLMMMIPPQPLPHTSTISQPILQNAWCAG